MRKICLVFAMICFSASLSAQYNSVGFGVGTSAFRGETSNDEMSYFEELGRSAYVHYNYWWKDSRWQYSIMASYHQIRGRIQIRDILRSNTLYQARSRHFNLGLGLRFYLDSQLSRYRPSEGQWAFFGAGYLGLESFFSNIEADRLGVNRTQTVTGDFQVSPFICGEGGLRVFLGPEWYSELTFGMKYGFNDYWDGISGHTGVNDFLIYGHLGFGYAF